MDPAEAVVRVRERRHEVLLFEVGVGALAASQRLFVLRQLDQGPRALELEPRDQLGLRL